MSEHLIKQIGINFEKLIDFLQVSVKESIRSLKYLEKLPQHFQDLQNEINRGFSTQISAMGEIEIHSKTSELLAQKQLISDENEVIEEFKQRLGEDIKRIDERYTKIQMELTEQCSKRVRELDSHLLDLPKSFPLDFTDGVSTKIKPFLQKLKLDASVSHQERIMLLKSIAEKSANEAKSFVELRNELFKKIDNYQQEEVVKSEKNYQIPLWIVETKDLKTGEIKTEFYLPGKINFGNFTSYQNDPLLKEYASEIEKKDKRNKNFQKINWTKNQKTKEMVDNRITKLLELDRSVNSTMIESFKKFIEASDLQTIQNVQI